MELQRGLRALADATRLKIVRLLLTHDMCVGALARSLNMSSAAISQHLRLLREAGLVKGEKRGYWTHYSVEREGLIELADEIRRLEAQSLQHRHTCQHECSGTKEGRTNGTCECNHRP